MTAIIAHYEGSLHRALFPTPASCQRLIIAPSNSSQGGVEPGPPQETAVHLLGRHRSGRAIAAAQSILSGVTKMESVSLSGLYSGTIVDLDEVQVLKTLGEGSSGTTQLAW